jgi:hypothetical protein
MKSVAEIVKNGGTATFNYLRQGIAYYNIVVHEKDKFFRYTFPVPLDDIGNATLSLYEKPLMMMRYVRKALEDGTLIEVENKYE